MPQIPEYDAILQWAQENHPGFLQITKLWVRPYLVKTYIDKTQTLDQIADQWEFLEHTYIWYRIGNDILYEHNRPTIKVASNKIYNTTTYPTYPNALQDYEDTTVNLEDPNLFDKITHAIKQKDQKIRKNPNMICYAEKYPQKQIETIGTFHLKQPTRK